MQRSCLWILSQSLVDSMTPAHCTAAGSPPLCCCTLSHASTLTNTPRLLYLLCSPSSTCYSLLHPCQHRGRYRHLQKHLQQHSAAPAVTRLHPAYSCVRSRVCRAAPVSDIHRSSPWSTSSMLPARQTACVLGLEAGMQRSLGGGTKGWYTSDLQSWFLN